MSTTELFLGIDGGGTSCRARLTTWNGRVLGEGRAGSANPRLGLMLAYDNILAATRQALQQAGLDESAMSRLHAGLGLAGTAQRKERQQVLGYPHPFASVTLLTDAQVACLGAFGGGEGAILIMGTGSCGVAYIDGVFHSVGGWGFPISDQGSGAWLGLLTLQQSLLAFERLVPRTPLSKAVMARFAYDQERVVAWMDSAKPKDYAALAPLVFEHARHGDALAHELLTRTGAEAARLIRGLLARGARHCCLMGGLSEAIRPWLPEAVRTVLVEPQGDALDGAILLARQRTRWES